MKAHLPVELMKERGRLAAALPPYTLRNDPRVLELASLDSRIIAALPEGMTEVEAWREFRKEEEG